MWKLSKANLIGEIMKKIIFGIIIGFITMGLIVWNIMPKMMMTVSKSKFDFDETVGRIERAVYENGWSVLHTYDIGNCLANEGFEEQLIQVNVISICRAELSYKILERIENRFIAGIMPCRIAIYENDEGNVFVSRMNIGLMSKIFGGTIEKIMSEAAIDEVKILENILE
jgi:uncharacterized protein (DUF302 family)